MNGWSHHLIVAPILIPLIASALLLFIDERRRGHKAMVSLASAILLVVIAFILFRIGGPNGFEASISSVTGQRRSASCWFSMASPQ